MYVRALQPMRVSEDLMAQLHSNKPFALHLVMKVKEVLFGYRLVVSKSFLVISTLVLYLYCLLNSI